MRLKKLGTALVIVAALGASSASSSQAAAVTEDVKWYTGFPPTELAGSLSITAQQFGVGTFETWVSGFQVRLETTFTECVECKIENSGGVAVGSGKLKFTGVKVLKPANCSTSSSITTNRLSVTADWMIFERNYIKFVPTAGESTAFASFELTGAACPVKTAIIPKGSLFVQSVSATGHFAEEQRVESSVFINAEAGGNLHVGVEPARLETTLILGAGGALFGTL